MKVLKRDGSSAPVDFNKITTRITKLCNEFGNNAVDPIIVSQKVCNALHDNVKTTELDKLASEIAISMGTLHYDYATLAAYIVASDLQKQVAHGFVKAMEMLFESGFLSSEIIDIVHANSDTIVDAIDYSRDYTFDYFALKTLEKGYLQKVKGVVVERPQDMFMRVSLGIHGSDIDGALQTYDMMSRKLFTHATPTLFNSGSNKPQLASCYLVMMQDDHSRHLLDSERLRDDFQVGRWNWASYPQHS